MKFFVLRRLDFEDADDVTEFHFAEGSRMGPAPLCSTCGNSIGLLQPVPPVITVVEGFGPHWGDIAFGPGDTILISKQLKELVRKHEMRGFSRLHPVSIRRTIVHGSTSVKDMPEYWIASIERSKTLLDEAASGLVREKGEFCEACRTGGPLVRISRIVVNENSWDGEDIFCAEGLPGEILVSENFKHMCSANLLRNCYFTLAEEFGFDHYGDILRS